VEGENDMPLPLPNGKRNKKAFISDCMSSEKMKKEFPNNKQRLAVCYSQHKRAKGSDCTDWEVWFEGQDVFFWD
jgi:hypothetical protein